jgi:signal peptidase I
LPRRGDVAVFIQPVTGDTMIKRVIGLPGDTILVQGGRLFINGEAAETSPPELIRRRAYPDRPQVAEREAERLPGGYAHTILNLTDVGELDEFGPYVVPAGHVFMMGDNRDNSLDSRWPGMGPVPIENLIGRAEIVHVTGPGCEGRENGFDCPIPRWLRPLHN